MKKCSKCEEIKELNCFYKCKNNKDGLHNSCKDCFKKKAKSVYQNNKEKIRDRQKEYYDKNKDKLLESQRKHYQDNKDMFKDRFSQYYQNNRNERLEYQRNYSSRNKNKALESRKKCYKENPNYQKELTAKRRAQKLNATVDGYEEEIKNIYKNCPENHSVDHIHPLISKSVCGLHVPWNLQYLTKEDNLKKGNKFDGTVENNSWKDGKEK